MAIKVKKVKSKKKVQNNQGWRQNWETDLPPKKYRVEVKEAIWCAGNANRLAKQLGVTRSAVYQWLPPYRVDPYLPKRQGIIFMGNQFLRQRLRKLRKEKPPPE